MFCILESGKVLALQRTLRYTVVLLFLSHSLIICSSFQALQSEVEGLEDVKIVDMSVCTKSMSLSHVVALSGLFSLSRSLFAILEALNTLTLYTAMPVLMQLRRPGSSVHMGPRQAHARLPAVRRPRAGRGGTESARAHPLPGQLPLVPLSHSLPVSFSLSLF